MNDLRNKNNRKLLEFIGDEAERLRSIGKMRTSETYTSTMHSFSRFRNGRDMSLSRFNADVAACYQAYLLESCLSYNTVSFYMRVMRAIYNRAVERGLVKQQYPFKDVYTGICKTIKRAISLKSIKKLKQMDLSGHPKKEFARDMFMFALYTRGMSFIDMSYLRKTDISHGVLSYRRHKTGQQLFVRWEACMQAIVDKYNDPQSPYLLPIIQIPGRDERKQYINCSHVIIRNLRRLGTELGLQVPLTMYVARHSWASIAYRNNIPLSIISEGMGHDSETTTRIYLASIDNSAIDKANRKILKLF